MKPLCALAVSVLAGCVGLGTYTTVASPDKFTQQYQREKPITTKEEFERIWGPPREKQLVKGIEFYRVPGQNQEVRGKEKWIYSGDIAWRGFALWLGIP